MRLVKGEPCPHTAPGGGGLHLGGLQRTCPEVNLGPWTQARTLVAKERARGCPLPQHTHACSQGLGVQHGADRPHSGCAASGPQGPRVQGHRTRDGRVTWPAEKQPGMLANPHTARVSERLHSRHLSWPSLCRDWVSRRDLHPIAGLPRSQLGALRGLPGTRHILSGLGFGHGSPQWEMGPGMHPGRGGQEHAVSLSPCSLWGRRGGGQSQYRGPQSPATNLWPGLRERRAPWILAGGPELPWRKRESRLWLPHSHSQRVPAHDCTANLPLVCPLLGPPPAGVLAGIPPRPRPSSLTRGHRRFLLPELLWGKHQGAGTSGVRGAGLPSLAPLGDSPPLPRLAAQGQAGCLLEGQAEQAEGGAQGLGQPGGAVAGGLGVSGSGGWEGNWLCRHGKVGKAWL